MFYQTPVGQPYIFIGPPVVGNKFSQTPYLRNIHTFFVERTRIFCHRQRGGPEKIGDQRSQTDAPLLVKMITPLRLTSIFIKLFPRHVNLKYRTPGLYNRLYLLKSSLLTHPRWIYRKFISVQAEICRGHKLECIAPIPEKIVASKMQFLSQDIIIIECSIFVQFAACTSCTSKESNGMKFMALDNPSTIRIGNFVYNCVMHSGDDELNLTLLHDFISRTMLRDVTTQIGQFMCNLQIII